MTVEELKDIVEAYQYSQKMAFKDDEIESEIKENETIIKKARHAIKSNMTKTQSNIMIDHIFGNLTIQDVADKSSYTTRSIDRMIERANKILKAL